MSSLTQFPQHSNHNHYTNPTIFIPQHTLSITLQPVTPPPHPTIQNNPTTIPLSPPFYIYYLYKPSILTLFIFTIYPYIFIISLHTIYTYHQHKPTWTPTTLAQPSRYSSPPQDSCPPLCYAPLSGRSPGLSGRELFSVRVV